MTTLSGKNFDDSHYTEKEMVCSFHKLSRLLSGKAHDIRLLSPSIDPGTGGLVLHWVLRAGQGIVAPSHALSKQPVCGPPWPKSSICGPHGKVRIAPKERMAATQYRSQS